MPEPPPASRLKRVAPRVVLLWVLAAILVAIALNQAAPWILPVRIQEGPLVQMTTEDGATLVWYTTRQTKCTVQVTAGGQARSEAATATGRRNVARITGLAPGRTYDYEIKAEGRTLTHGLAFQTNRPLGEPFTFLVFGDSGYGIRRQYQLGLQMTVAQPQADFVLHTGDLIYDHASRRLYEQAFFAPYRGLLARVAFWPSYGNHDLDDGGLGAAMAEVFELPDNGPPGLPPDHNYWFDYASVRIAVIDSNAREDVLRDQVAPWLSSVMGAPAPRWRFVVFHHPPYTGGRYPCDERIQRTLVPVFETVGVDIVFNGHDHTYQRTYPLRAGQIVPPGEGVQYVVTGAGGANLYEIHEPRPPFLAASDDKNFSYTQVTIAGNTLHLWQTALGGKVLDDYVWDKSMKTRPQAPTTSGPATSESQP